MKRQREPSRASGQRPCSYQSQGTPSGGAPEGARPLFRGLDPRLRSPLCRPAGPPPLRAGVKRGGAAQG